MPIKKILTAMLCFILGAGVAGCGKTANSNDNITVEKNILRVGVRDSVPGFSYKNPDSGIYTGLEIDIAKDLAAATGSSLKLVPVKGPQEIISLIDGGEIDCAISTFTVTEEREKKYDFSVSYYSDYVKILVENSSKIATIKDLTGLTVGAVSGSTAAEALTSEMMNSGYIPKKSLSDFDAATFNGGVSFKLYDDYADLAYGLETGAVDAAAGDGSLLLGYNTEGRSFLDAKLEEQNYAICMKKGSPLKETADKIVRNLIADGTIELYMTNHGLKE